jgi:hypothetical protein
MSDPDGEGGMIAFVGVGRKHEMARSHEGCPRGSCSCRAKFAYCVSFLFACKRKKLTQRFRRRPNRPRPQARWSWSNPPPALPSPLWAVPSLSAVLARPFCSRPMCIFCRYRGSPSHISASRRVSSCCLVSAKGSPGPSQTRYAVSPENKQFGITGDNPYWVAPSSRGGHPNTESQPIAK